MNKKHKAKHKADETKVQSSAIVWPESDSAPPKPATEKQLQDVGAQMSVYEQSTLRWARTAVVLSFLAFVAIGTQWLEMKKARDLSADTAKQQMRAYVLYATSTAVFSKGTYVVSVEFKNFGQTPAYNLTSVITPEVRTPMVNPFNQMMAGKEQTSDESTDLGPSQPWKVETTPQPIADAASIGRDKALYAWALIEYRDRFQRCQYTAIDLRSDGRVLDDGTLRMVVVRSETADPEVACGPDPEENGSKKALWPDKRRTYVPQK